MGTYFISDQLVSMAVISNDERSNRPIDGISQPTMQEAAPINIQHYMRGHLSRDYDDYQVNQKMQIEKGTLKFLKKCRKYKRPPQSIRISGANVVEEEDKLNYFSKFETTLLEHQITCKESLIKELKNQGKNVPYLKLPCIDRRKLYKHYKKKLKFYSVQDNTKWQNWPSKEINSKLEVKKKKVNRKDRNYKKRQKRNNRKTKQAAKRAIDSGSVVVLVDEEIPLGAIAVLGKGFGYVPIPQSNAANERLQMRQTANRILSASRKQCTPTSEQSVVVNEEQMPTKLKHTSYNLNQPAPDKNVNTILDRLVSQHNAVLLTNKQKKNIRSNLTKDESDGLIWLKDMTNKGKISVVQADKGGAILIVPPELLRRKVLEKLENPQLYTKLEHDPLNNLKKELFEIWKVGKTQGHITSKTAYDIAGVTENNNMSTSPQFKPGVSYFYPMLKIHKVKKEDLLPGVDPPARLVTSLREGVAKRSDVFLADHFLKELEKDFCKDLLLDTSDALRWLDTADTNLNTETKKTMKCFTFDFKSLYDSLDPNLVKEALAYAMDTCRLWWSTELKEWIMSLIEFSLRASIAKYDDAWYKQNNGVPTGGSLCVQIANITIFYAMFKKVYSQEYMMTHISEIKRYIDDGIGFFFGSERQFDNWLNDVNVNIGTLGLTIDESNFQEPTNYINFLDIQFCFDSEGVLQTDLHTKETDSRSYLNFTSAHPNHTFSGNVYAQCLRLRRIINSQERLHHRMNDLADCFKKAGYPEKMVSEISTKVQNSERDISIKQKIETLNSNQIRVISTYKADNTLVDVVRKSEESFKQTASFRNLTGPLFTFVKNVGPNIKSQVNNLKHQALGTKKGGLRKCNGPGCKCCPMLLTSASTVVNKKKIRLAHGSCKTYNICYLGVCDICNKPYTGRTVDPLHIRINGHRYWYKDVLKKAAANKLQKLDTKNKDLYSLGLHLHLDHGLTDPNAFDKNYKFAILEIVSPSEIETKEYRWMHHLNSFQPHGINTEYPFGIPYLG